MPRVRGRRSGEVISSAHITVDPVRDVPEARIMVDHKIGDLPMLERRELVGVVTDTHLLRALAAGIGDLAVAA